MSHRLPAPAATNLKRRRLVQAVGAAALPAAWWPAAHGAGSALEGYASKVSLRAGERIGFHLRDPLGSTTADRTFAVTVMRVGWPDVAMWSGSVKVRKRSVPNNASSAGCGWAESLGLTLPASWPSGAYYAVFGSGSAVCAVPFVLRPAAGTAPVGLLVQVPVTTAQAYNNYGGKSLYSYNSSGGVPAVKVSFDRPLTNSWADTFDWLGAPMLRWLAKNGIAAHFCTSVDLHADASVLSGYRLFLTAGHDEYWSRPMRERLDTHVNAGGNAAIFSGNTCWWQVRFETGKLGANRVMVCYKSVTADPDSRAAYKTANWIDLNPPTPENSTIGLGWKLGCSWTGGGTRPDTPYALQRGGHWAFEGTGLAQGSRFAGAYAGYEADALATVRGADQLLHTAGSDGTPASLRVLAVADATQWDAISQSQGQSGEKSGLAVIGVFSRGGSAGTVFNGGTTDWCLALRPELDGQTPQVLSRITYNVVTRLATRWVELADVRQWSQVQTSGDGVRHTYTTGMAPAGFATLDGVAFQAHLAAQANTVPVYVYSAAQANGDGARYFYSLSSTLGNGWTLQGVAFHAHAEPRAGTVAVYQHHRVQTNGDGWRFYYSTHATAPNGWEVDGVAFYAPVG